MNRAIYICVELDELKMVYRILRSHAHEHEELDNSEFANDLQAHLEHEAMADGVDLHDDDAWEVWLGSDVILNAVSDLRREQLN